MGCLPAPKLWYSLGCRESSCLALWLWNSPVPPALLGLTPSAGGEVTVMMALQLHRDVPRSPRVLRSKKTP